MLDQIAEREISYSFYETLNLDDRVRLHSSSFKNDNVTFTRKYFDLFGGFRYTRIHHCFITWANPCLFLKYSCYAAAVTFWNRSIPKEIHHFCLLAWLDQFIAVASVSNTPSIGLLPAFHAGRASKHLTGGGPLNGRQEQQNYIRTSK